MPLHVPIVPWLLIGYFEEAPSEAEDAVLVDGDNSFYVFLKIAVLMVRSESITSAILVFVIYWNEYLFGLILAWHAAAHLTIAIYRFGAIEFAASGHNVIAAYSILIVLPNIIVCSNI